MDWNFKMYINGVYWKGYGGRPTFQQKEIETRSFKKSSYYQGGEVEMVVRNR